MTIYATRDPVEPGDARPVWHGRIESGSAFDADAISAGLSNPPKL
ncbi:hypothetical protein ACG3SL_08145 [Sphingomonas sp. CJ20]